MFNGGVVWCVGTSARIVSHNMNRNAQFREY